MCSTALSSPPTGARLISTQWHPDWRLETRIAEPKKITTITYNGQGATCAPSTVLVDGKPPAVICTRTEQATTDETGAAGFATTVTGTARTWRYTYSTYGRVLTATDPNNRTTTTSYHPDNDAELGKRGNVASITNAANHTTFITDYNPHGQPTRVVDPNGVVTVLTYDPRMRLTSRTVGNEATVFGYDPVGQMTSVNLPDGARLTYSYDAAHRLTAINDHKGNRIDYTLDAMGNRITEKTKDPGGVLVGNIARVIDALNRVQQVTGNATGLRAHMRTSHASFWFVFCRVALLTAWPTILLFTFPIAEGAQTGTSACLQYGGLTHDCKPPDFSPWGNYGTGHCGHSSPLRLTRWHARLTYSVVELVLPTRTSAPLANRQKQGRPGPLFPRRLAGLTSKRVDP